jgi:hypothetical protein
MQRRLIRCIECNEIINLTEHDFSSEYDYNEKEDRFIEYLIDDREPFKTKHKNHKIEELKVNKDSYISDSLYFEPLKVCYFEATNGSEVFVIKAGRDNIEFPLRYELIKGHIEIMGSKLEVQGDNIRRQVRAEINQPFSEDKMDRFIQVIERYISQLDPEALLDDSLESDNPLLLYCKLKGSHIKSIIELSKDIFTKAELKKIRDFIYDNSDHYGVISPLLKRQFEIKHHQRKGRYNKAFPLSDNNLY